MEKIIFKNSITDESVTFDRTNFLLNLLDYGSASASHAEYKGYSQIGVYNTMSTIETRRIRVVGYIFASDSDDMRQKRRLLSRVTSPLNNFEIIKGTYKLTCSSISTPSYSTEPAMTGDTAAKFTLTAICHFPCWTATEASKAGYATYDGRLIYPIAIDKSGFVFGARTPAFVVRTYNFGDLACGGIFTIKSDLAIDFVEVRDNHAGEFFRVNKPLMPGESIVVDTRYSKKNVFLVNESGEENIFGCLYWKSSFLQIPTGETVFDIIVGGNSAGVVAEIEFAPMYF